MSIPSSTQNLKELAASEERQEEVARRYLTGSSMRRISQQMGISLSTVARDLQRTREAWQERNARTYEELLPEKLAALDVIRAQAWIGWKRSLRDERSETDETGTNGHGPFSKQRKRRKGQSGNPNYLSRLESCLRLECELRGMLNKDTGGNVNVAADVVEIVITTRAEHEEFKTLSMDEFRKLSGKVG